MYSNLPRTIQQSQLSNTVRVKPDSNKHHINHYNIPCVSHVMTTSKSMSLKYTDKSSYRTSPHMRLLNYQKGNGFLVYV